ncbi:hypothetical protein QF205_00970 [Luteimonas composti]|uniref:DUF2884 family protein n=1 Tax=Luteimonas composti TaxID=398257 RepID=A0ABT6MM35_9GAMM|nr:hypothetical protein [Luteimonas composti]MDH7451652.1 hypothetical protein [Luteimonas composti]
MKSLATIALLACLPLLGACQRDDAAASAPPAAEQADTRPAPQTALGRTVAAAMDKARQELHEGNLSLNGSTDIRINGKRVHRNADDLPKAEIAPDGQLIVAGNAVAMDAATRALAREYREGILAVAETGMDLGVQGADLGMRAAADAIGSLLRGDTEEMEKRVEAEAAALEASALRLCDHLPALLAAQDALAAAVPEFAPYARMETSDIEDCRDASEHGSAPADASAAAEADAAAARAD